MSALVAALLAGCSAGSFIGDHAPAAVGGLPDDAPARPAAALDYPAVHDMPPPRATTTLSYDQQQLLQNDLIAVRDRACAAAIGTSPAGATANAAAGGTPSTGATANSAAPACNPAAAAPKQ